MLSKVNLDSRLFLSSFQNFNNPSGKNIYVGLGVCARGSMSKAIPFDIFSMILCAEAFRRYLKSDQVFYIIADTHAALTGHDPNRILDYSLQLSKFLDNIFRVWNVPHQNVLASFINDISYKSAIQSSANERYMQAEIADMFYFAEKHDVGVKLGWKYDPASAGKKRLGFDEWYFDRYARKIHVPLQFGYAISGRTMNPSTPIVSPYLCLDKNSRIILKDLHMEDKLRMMSESSETAIQHYISYIQEIQMLYCRLFHKPIKSWQQFTRDLCKTFS